jgi:hypothetical protein
MCKYKQHKLIGGGESTYHNLLLSILIHLANIMVIIY